MRILHVPYAFHPDPPGGTEVYVDGLAACQRALGLEPAVAAPASPGSAPNQYDYAGTPVWRFKISPSLTLRQLYGEGDPVAAHSFGRILDEFHPDVVHLHALTSAISVLLTDQASERGIPVVFNYHTPTATCTRGTLLEWGSAICDGKLDRHRCAACNLHGQGAPRAIASLIAAQPAPFSRYLSATGREGGIWTALRMPELIDVRIAAFSRMMSMCDRIIALCNWTRELLLRNGIPENKLTLCRQGIHWSPEASPTLASRNPAALPVRAIFLGRMDATKGPHLLVDALRRSPELPLRLDLYGIRQGHEGDSYAEKLTSMIGPTIGGDTRIRLLPPVPSSDVIARLHEYDVVLVPSQWLETGPLVVLEAFAARTPVIGSDLGGIAELVTHGVNGLLVSPYHSVEAWSAALQRICDEPSLLNSLRANIRPPRHTREVASDLMPVYENVLRSACAASAKDVHV